MGLNSRGDGPGPTKDPFRNARRTRGRPEHPTGGSRARPTPSARRDRADGLIATP